MSTNTVTPSLQTQQFNGAQPEPAAPISAKRRHLHIAGPALILVAIAIAAWYYFAARPYESTDNAFIEGDIIQLAPRVAGQVLRVHVTDNQHVNRGDLLVEIDSSDYDARLSEASGRLSDITARASSAQTAVDLTSTVSGAQLIQATAGSDAVREQLQVLNARLQADEANILTGRASLQQAEARKTAAEAEANRSATDASRYRALYAKDEVSKQILDRSETEAHSTAANLEAARQAVAAATAQLAQLQAAHASTLATMRQAEQQIRQAEGRVREAQSAPQQVRVRQSDLLALRAQIEQQRASVHQAELNLSYTRIYAPDSGYITRKSVQPGNFVQIGQALMALVSDRLWVVANFKETQLTHMRPGQPVTIKIDAYPQQKFNGRVDSIQSGSGARFSLVPPENATGNYVKVVQRVPVKIRFDAPVPPEYKVGPGMSVIPEVKVR